VILALSTSSPWVSVALIGPDSQVVGHGSSTGPQSASGECLKLATRLLSDRGLDWRDLTGIATDQGPGSFIGTRVGVMVAKAMGFVIGVRVAGVSSFDLIDPSGAAAVPCRKAEYLVRELGLHPYRCASPPASAKGYGPDFKTQSFPSAKGVAEILDRLEWIEPEALTPEYVLEPSITQPFKRAATGGL
jgi:hypothetical protein